MTNFAENNPYLWTKLLPLKKEKQHKYDHGHALIYGAPELTGATTLAAHACSRVGTGLVSVLSPENKGNLYRTILSPHILVRDNLDYNSETITAKLYGSGGLSTKPDYVSTIPTVLDADALYSLPKCLSPNFILTPHQGEFDKAFPNIVGSKVEKIRIVTRRLNCHIVLKGAETLIANPNGDVVVNKHANPWLATAGSGDVLAGMITGFLAQRMPIFETSCAAVWIHGESAIKFGRYLVASDLPDIIPSVLNEVLDKYRI